MITLVLQQAQMLCRSVNKINCNGGSPTDIIYDGEGTGEARVKVTNVWDEEW